MNDHHDHLPRPRLPRFPFTLRVRGNTYDVINAAGLRQLLIGLGRSPAWIAASSNDEIADYLFNAERAHMG